MSAQRHSWYTKQWMCQWKQTANQMEDGPLLIKAPKQEVSSLRYENLPYLPLPICSRTGPSSCLCLCRIWRAYVLCHTQFLLLLSFPCLYDWWQKLIRFFFMKSDMIDLIDWPVKGEVLFTMMGLRCWRCTYDGQGMADCETTLM